MAPKNPYETTQNNFSGTSTNPNEYATTQGNWSGTGGSGGGNGGGADNPYLNTQGNWSGTGGDGYVPPTMDAIQDMMNTTLGNWTPPVYSGPSLEDFGSMMDNKLAGYMTPDQVQAMMSGTMGGGDAASYDKFKSNLSDLGYMTAADVESMMADTMSNWTPQGSSGPSMEEIQNMMNTTMGNFNTGPSMDEIENLMNTTMGNYMNTEQVQDLMQSTMGAQDPGSASAKVVAGDTNVDVNLGGDAPGMSLAELSQFLGQDQHGCGW